MATAAAKNLSPRANEVKHTEKKQEPTSVLNAAREKIVVNEIRQAVNAQKQSAWRLGRILHEARNLVQSAGKVFSAWLELYQDEISISRSLAYEYIGMYEAIPDEATAMALGDQVLRLLLKIPKEQRTEAASALKEVKPKGKKFPVREAKAAIAPYKRTPKSTLSARNLSSEEIGLELMAWLNTRWPEGQPKQAEMWMNELKVIIISTPSGFSKIKEFQASRPDYIMRSGDITTAARTLLRELSAPKSGVDLERSKIVQIVQAQPFMRSSEENRIVSRAFAPHEDVTMNKWIDDEFQEIPKEAYIRVELVWFYPKK